MRIPTFLEFVSLRANARKEQNDGSVIFIVEDSSVDENYNELDAFFRRIHVVCSANELSDVINGDNNINLVLYITDDIADDVKTILRAQIQINPDLWILCLLTGAAIVRRDNHKWKMAIICRVEFKDNILSEDKMTNYRRFVKDVTDKYGDCIMLGTNI